MHTSQDNSTCSRTAPRDTMRTSDRSAWAAAARSPNERPIISNDGDMGMDTTRASLLLRVRDRADAEAWREFDALYRPMLMRFGLAGGLSEADAEDVTQHCMAAIHRHIDGFDYDPRKGRFKGWLRTLVNNRVRDLLGRRRERPAPSGVFADRAAGGPTPEAAFDRIWREEHLKQCLRSIRFDAEPTTFRAFEMYVLQQRPVAEVCRALGVSAGHLYVIKSRLTKQLRERLKELSYDDE